MRCAACHRTLLTPAYTAPTRMGGYVLGRVCAEKAGKVKPKRRKCQIKQATVQDGQLDMFVILECAGQWPKNLPLYEPTQGGAQ